MTHLRHRSAARRLLRFALPVALLALGAPGAWAACTKNPAYTERVINMVMGTIVVPNDAVVGQKIGEKDFPVYTAGVNNQPWVCNGAGGTVSGVMLQGQDLNFPGLEKLYSTNVPGIGIRLLRTISSTQKTYYPHTLSGSFGSFDPNAAFRVEVYKTAATTGSGPLASGTYTQYYSLDDGKSVLTTFLSANAITIITPTCSVDVGSRNISVQFGKVPQSDFKGRGTTAAERNFNIKLNCKAGTGITNTVYLRMDATKDPAGDDGVLRITQGSTGIATGVGIQVIDGQKAPVKYGEGALVGPSKDGDYTLPYTARYFQTGNAVTPGRADGTATFTLEYK
ncbi:fimbrial protein [Variovorax sp.]|jgi:type 1 fimbria pilin|uniref:fimbrial protein n=1 Tax=Variovorax sp. TaxID=1871043 RepID=UPI000C633CE3|nr:fimbrial protein [Variovorax sp.]MBS78922.1 fimbrial protein [Variovorax sp.]